MKLFVVLGASFITIASVIYSITIYLEIRYGKITKKLLRLFRISVVFDFLATLSMFIYAGKFIINSHGLLGYIALILMLSKLIYISIFNKKYGEDEKLPGNIRVISLLLFAYWIFAYINGAMTAMR